MTSGNHLRVDYIEIPVTSVAEAKKFYGAVFDWRFEDYGPDYASFFDGRLSGGFTTVQTLKESGPLVIIYSVDLEETKRKVVEAAGKIVKETFEFPGGRRFHFSDPSGISLPVVGPTLALIV